eukprot:3349423-Amphidinium_carterae.1
MARCESSCTTPQCHSRHEPAIESFSILLGTVCPSLAGCGARTDWLRLRLLGCSFSSAACSPAVGTNSSQSSRPQSKTKREVERLEE